MYRCESRTVKKAECQRIDAFVLWFWRRLLRVSWKTRKSNLSVLKEINPEYSLEGLMLKLQYFGYLMGTANSLEKILMLGKTEGRRRGDRGWDGWIASLIQWTRTSANSKRWWGTGKPGVLQTMGLQRAGRDLATEQHKHIHHILLNQPHSGAYLHHCLLFGPKTTLPKSLMRIYLYNSLFCFTFLYLGLLCQTEQIFQILMWVTSL